MPNTIKTLSDGDITREALRILKNSNATLRSVNRQYDDRFGKTGAKNGGTLQIRLPNLYTVGTGRTVTPQDTTELTTALVVGTQKHVPVQFFADELTLSLDDFSDRILKPAMSVLASNISSSVCTAQAQAFTHQVGTAGTTPSSFLMFAQAGELLDQLADSNRSMAAIERNALWPQVAGDGLIVVGPSTTHSGPSSFHEADIRLWRSGRHFGFPESTLTLEYGLHRRGGQRDDILITQTRR